MAEIHKPISIESLASLLGVSESIRPICTAPSINMWAKRKPFRDSASAYTSDTERDAARKAVDYGLSIPFFSSISAMLTRAKSYGVRTLCWGYNKPRGLGSGEWYRLLDFDGYTTERNQPFVDWKAAPLDSYLIDPSPEVYDDSPIPPSPGVDVPYLQKSDFTSLSTMPYVGFAFRVKGTTTVYAFTINTRTDIPFSQIGKTYECCFFYSKVSITYGGTLPQGTNYFALLPIPYLEMSVNEDFGISFGGEGLPGFGTSVTYTPNYTNLGTERDIHHVRICVRNVAHWTYQSSAPFGQQYTIEKHASTDTSYKEADYDGWYDGENESTDKTLHLKVGTFPLSDGPYEQMVTFQNVDPYLSPLVSKWFMAFSIGGNNYVLDITPYIHWPVRPTPDF